MSVTSTTINNTATVPTLTAADAKVTADTFQFVAGWVLLVIILVFANKTRLGHVLIYYSLLLILLFILVTEAPRIAPLLNNLQTIGDFNKRSVK